MDRPKHVTRPTLPRATTETAKLLVDVFISYARADAKIASNLADTLRSEGFEVWFDRKIYAGANWNSLSMDTLSSAKAILVLWSHRSIRRRWVLKEAQIAMDGQRLVPAKIDDCRLPARFGVLQTALMPGWSGTGPHPELQRLLDGLTRLAPPSHVGTVRPGFDTGFLGFDINLPAITGVADEFRYLHFSVIMNPARRLAWYVAYNMQPHGNPRRGDQWTPDPMLPSSFQPQNSHFLGTGFDRGHLAAPLSVSWGPPGQAQLANNQSFFWTNTAPQHPNLNRGWWLSVEEWERKMVDVHGKAIGFSGPVLAEDDPIQRGVEQSIGRLRVRQNFRLPRQFWKIVVVGDVRDKLKSAAFILNQDLLLKNGVPLRSKASDFRCTVAEIESLTGLDFGDTIRNSSPIP